LFFVEPEVKCQWTVLVEYLTILTNVLAVIKHVVDNNIICFSATQLMHAPALAAHGARYTVQQLLRKTLNFINSFELWPQRPELNSIDYKI